LLILGVAAPAPAHETTPDILKNIGFDQRLNEQVPLDLAFRDEAGRTVRLGEYFGQKPVILSLVYYHCTTLCPLILNGLVKSLDGISFDLGKQFAIVTVSIDPREGPAEAAAKKAQVLPRYGRPGGEAGWHFLTGEEAAIQQLTKAAGFRYAYDAKADEFAHPAGIMVLTPQGKIARYFYGIDFSARDLRLGLIEAAAGKIGNPVDQVVLYCYHYDPVTGKYGFIVMNAIRLAGVATVLVLGIFIAVMLRRERLARLKPREAR
jgi:protein SCO1/2